MAVVVLSLDDRNCLNGSCSVTKHYKNPIFWHRLFTFLPYTNRSWDITVFQLY